MHLSMLTPWVGGGGRERGGDLTFLQKKFQMPLPQDKIPHPQNEILFLKYLVSGALYTSGDREMTQIHFGGII